MKQAKDYEIFNGYIYKKILKIYLPPIPKKKKTKSKCIKFFSDVNKKNHHVNFIKGPFNNVGPTPPHVSAKPDPFPYIS